MNRSIHFLAALCATALFIGALSGCGGGSGGGLASNGGIGGTGVTAAGTITGFGSIFVNGIEFDTSTASFDVDENTNSTENDLALGMFVTVTGTVDSSGTTGTATSIVFDDEIQGPISAIDPGGPDPDMLTKTLVVLGVTILADKAATVYDNTSFGNLAVNDIIEVSGFVDNAGVIRATRIEKKLGTSEIELKGVVANLGATTFDLGAFTVDFSAADLSGVPGGTLSNGLQVEVKGTLNGNTITASRVDREDDLFNNDESHVSLEGIITAYNSNSDFVIAGQQVDASGASFEPAGLTLGNGVEVEVEGPVVSGILQASKVEARGGDIKLEATVFDKDANTGTLRLQYSVQSPPDIVVVTVNSQTTIKDDNSGSALSLGDIAAGNFLEVRGYLDANSNVIASEISRDNPDDDIVQAPVDSFVMNSSITLLGLTFSTVSGTTQFELLNDQNTDSTTFYNNLQNGALVKIEDKNQDGIADEVEFEN